MSKSTQRILRELQQCQKIENDQVSYVFQEEDDIQRWKAFLVGPPDSAYSKGVFYLSIRFPNDYPIVPPIIKFITTVFHPNVHQDTGEICLEVLKSDWRPFWTIQSTLHAI